MLPAPLAAACLQFPIPTAHAVPRLPSAGVPYPPYSYAVWCGVTTMALCAFCICCYLQTIGLVSSRTA